MFTIDKGVPMPNRRGSSMGKVPKYPWRTMDVGDSFFVASDAARPAVMAQASHSGKRTGRRFTTRFVTENGVRGVRVWRVE